MAAEEYAYDVPDIQMCGEAAGPGRPVLARCVRQAWLDGSAEKANPCDTKRSGIVSPPRWAVVVSQVPRILANRADGHADRTIDQRMREPMPLI